MLLIDEERFFFFADQSELDQDEGDGSSTAPRSGFSKWLGERIAKFKAAWQDAGSGALYWVRRVWDWLHTLLRPDEPMLARLRSARRIKLHHPATRSEGEVLSNWRNYLTRQRRRHFFWLGFNAVIAPISVILGPLPGPNLIGYWFAYRAVHHTIVVLGINRVQRNLIPTSYIRSSCSIGQLRTTAKALRHAALEGVEEELERHMSWWRGSWFGIPRVRRGEPVDPGQA